MYEKRLGDACYLNFKLARTNNRGDGLTDCRAQGDISEELQVPMIVETELLTLHVELAAPHSPSGNNDTRQEIRIVNTPHCYFPHDSRSTKILHYVESYQKENKLSPTPIMLSAFVSSYENAQQYTDADAHKWVEPP
ncbi:hypothetical protein NC652_034189 [Populus alba x Populus x berolinensis]|nr:hypothetical protein NC652_034189 [Populus alba x Populus x berolinensis]